jgi:RimJ/RimL family protein N-acetyltransferase
MLHPESWGMGYATEALKRFQERLFEVQPERVLLVAAVQEGNVGSENVLGKCGFLRVEGFPFVGGRNLSVEEEEELRGALVKARQGGVSGKEVVQGSGDFSWYCFENPNPT